MERRALTVTELNQRVKLLVDNDPLLYRVIVAGEISNYKVYPSAHYFSLQDTDSSVRCVMFRSEASRMRFRPENGMNVLCRGRISVYPRDGVYQLYVSEMQPDGLGELYAAYEQLKARLLAEGLFDPLHKKSLPAYPERIALITSASGAAVHDMIRILGTRWPLAKVIILPVHVQGTEAPSEIAEAIDEANRFHAADLIITGRGGGSIEDLWAFNDERVARAIYASDIPVISAVGHEPDVTIADFVADVRASTPSNAAELAVPDVREIYGHIGEVSERMNLAVNRSLSLLRSRCKELSARPVLQSADAFLRPQQQRMDELCVRLFAAGQHFVSDKRHQSERLAASLDALSPLKVLSRGYSVVMGQDGTILRSTKTIDKGDHVHIKLSDGGLNCLIEEKTEG